MHKRGFTIFFAVLVASLSLAVGLAIYDLLIRELELSQTARESQYAVYAADTGAECALYWDNKYTTDTDGSAFASSSADTWGSSITCNGQDITLQGPPSMDLSRYVECGGASSPWCTSSDANAATTTFSVNFTPLAHCAVVTVAKYGSPSQTTITSRGYNTCLDTGVERLERTLEVSY